MNKGNKHSIILKVYFFATRYFEIFLFLFLKYRLIKGKEDKNRIFERKGISNFERPQGKLIWFNAASVGESLSILNLVEELSKKNKNLYFLITTTTISSSIILKEKIPDNCIHQFSPIDTFSSSKKFLDHWKPDLAIFVESEFWPRLIFEVKKRGIPLGLINARMEKKTYESWSNIKNSAKLILEKFDFVYANDNVTSRRLLSLGISKSKLLGVVSSKEHAIPLSYELEEREKFLKIFHNKKVWVAASTHQGEEEILEATQKLLFDNDQNFLLILVPRHPDRGLDIYKKLKLNGQVIKIRSKGQKITKETSIYLADTLGELGLWYNLSKIVFLGGSLVKIGGHNPYEPCRFGNAIISGPNIFNFQEAFDQLRKNKALIIVKNAQELAVQIKNLSFKDNASLLGHRGFKYVNSLANNCSKIINTISTFT